MLKIYLTKFNLLMPIEFIIYILASKNVKCRTVKQSKPSFNYLINHATYCKLSYQPSKLCVCLRGL